MDQEAPLLLDVPTNAPRRALCFVQSDSPIWTENKAKLIERYIHYFVYVTKHGTYIDGFSGPQRGEKCWAAKLVLEDSPRRIRHFHLFEQDQEKVRKLEALRDGQRPHRKGDSKRKVHIYPGDCNVNILKVLEENPIRDKEATFCLLDQRTLECSWSTVVALANHKKAGHKIEIFYFLAQGWIDRTVKAKSINKDEDMMRWWGNDKWEDFFKLPRSERSEKFRLRFINELGYKYAYAFPIFEKKDGGKTMFWMIHATDHPDAPKLMNRAYRRALNTKGVGKQPDLFVREDSSPASSKESDSK